jgi:hypothetical protein
MTVLELVANENANIIMARTRRKGMQAERHDRMI